jgi:hypothetical protein
MIEENTMNKALTWQEIQDMKHADAWKKATGRKLKLRKRCQTKAERERDAVARDIARLKNKLKVA